MVLPVYHKCKIRELMVGKKGGRAEKGKGRDRRKVSKHLPIFKIFDSTY